MYNDACPLRGSVTLREPQRRRNVFYFSPSLSFLEHGEEKIQQWSAPPSIENGNLLLTAAEGAVITLELFVNPSHTVAQALFTLDLMGVGIPSNQITNTVLSDYKTGNRRVKANINSF